MNKKMKRIGSLLLALMLFFSLTACANNKDKETDTSKKPVTTEGDVKPDLEHVTLTMYYPGAAQVDEELVEEEINKYLKDKINASVDLMPIDWGVWFEKPNLMIGAGEEFDIMHTASWSNYETNVERGAFIPLNDLVDNYAPEIKDILPQAVLEGTKIKGEMYGIATNKEMATQVGLLFDKKLVDKYGFDLATIDKLEDIEPWLQTILENEPDTIPYFSGSGPRAILLYDVVGDGSPGVLVDGKVINQNITPETIEMYNLAYKWMKAGYINKDANQKPEFPDKLFCYWEPLKPGKDAEVSIQRGREFVQKEFSGTLTSVNNIQGSMLAISRTSKNPERAMMLIGLMNTDVYLNNLMNFGIEGVHYTKNEDNILTATDNTPNYSPGTTWMFQNQFINYLWDNEDPLKWEKFRAFNEHAEVSPLLGFTFDPLPVLDEIAALKNAMDQYAGALENGILNYEEHKDAFIKAMEGAGVSKVLEEKQRQVDAFLANK